MDCLVCGETSERFSSARILGKYDIEYSRCRDCGFIQTEKPYWLDEAYADAIISTDVGLVSRNERLARITDRLLRFAFPAAETCVDFGGGYGMFTRMMRDRGHDFRHRDPHCKNLFAAEHEADDGATGFDLVTVFEVFEHLPEPHVELEQLDQLAAHWLVSTEPVPDSVPKPDQWWYYALEGGQHISLWSKRALQAVASQYGRKLVSYRGLHVISGTPISEFLVRQLLRDKAARMLDPFARRRSLLAADYHKALEATKQAA